MAFGLSSGPRNWAGPGAMVIRRSTVPWCLDGVQPLVTGRAWSHGNQEEHDAMAFGLSSGPRNWAGPGAMVMLRC